MSIMGETTNAGDTGATDAGGSNPPTPPTPGKDKIERVDLSQPMKMRAPGEPAPQPVATPKTPVADMDKAVGDDIARILGTVKLPDRNATDTTPKKEAKTYDTAIGAESAAANADRAAMQAQVRDAALAVNDSLAAAAARPSDNVRPLHTLKDDIQDVVHHQQISVVRAAALQEEKRHRSGNLIPPEEMAPPQQARRTAPIVFTLVLFLVGAGALAGAYLILQNRAIDAVAPIQSGILFAEQAVPIQIDSLAPLDVRREIAAARGAGTLSLGAILQIIPAVIARDPQTGQNGPVPASFSAFMTGIGANPPDDLVRALSDDFFFGIHTVDENAPLFVIPVESYERAFAGMLAWERTMNADLAPMFAAVPMQTVGTDGVIIERTFSDAVIQNYDVRVLRDEGGMVQLYYSFPTRNILIIAESQYSFPELLSRLRADRRL